MKLSASTKCPYCGHEQQTTVSESSGQEITLCYPEDGGCDNWYAVFWRAYFNVDCYPIGTETQRKGEESGIKTAVEN